MSDRMLTALASIPMFTGALLLVSLQRPPALRVTALQSKIKINQHRPESHANLKAAYAAGNENERALAQWMATLGL